MNLKYNVERKKPEIKKKKTFCMIPFIWSLKTGKTNLSTELEVRIVDALRGMGRGLLEFWFCFTMLVCSL